MKKLIIVVFAMLLIFCACTPIVTPKDNNDNIDSLTSNESDTSLTQSTTYQDTDVPSKGGYNYNATFVTSGERLFEKSDNYILFETEKDLNFVYAVWDDRGKLLASEQIFPEPEFRLFDGHILRMKRHLGAGYDVINFFNLKNGAVSESYEIYGFFAECVIGKKVFFSYLLPDDNFEKMVLLIENVTDNKTVMSKIIKTSPSFFECTALEFTGNDTIEIEYIVYDSDYNISETIKTAFMF